MPLAGKFSNGSKYFATSAASSFEVATQANDKLARAVFVLAQKSLSAVHRY